PSPLNRRDFMIGSAALAAARAGFPMKSSINSPSLSGNWDEFNLYQQRRRWELGNLLGDLPWGHQPTPPRVIRTEKHDGYTLERLVLDLNGVEPVPALLLIPVRGQGRGPGLPFFHWPP